jgi:hypothetical protein
LAVFSALCRRMYGCLLMRTPMTYVYDQQPVYSVSKYIRLKCSCVENLHFVVIGTCTIDRTCIFSAQG